MAGAAQGSCSQTALMIVHSASVSSIVRFGMDEQLSLVIELYSCKDVNTIFYSCRALGTGLPTKPENALQMDGTNDGHKKAQKHAALVLFVAHGFTVCSNRISSATRSTASICPSFAPAAPPLDPGQFAGRQPDHLVVGRGGTGGEKGEGEQQNSRGDDSEFERHLPIALARG